MKLSEYMKGPWLAHAIETVEDRAIPSFIDGLKPVQRFLVASGMSKCKNEWIKTNALGSSVAAYGHEHGEESATKALQLMTAYFCNNLCLFQGDGNFGNVLNPKPAQGRYTHVRLSQFFDKLFKDFDFCQSNEDPEVKTPIFYLPIIPYVLVNGIKGIATGYATNIFPYDPIDVIDILIEMTKGKKARCPKLKFYGFSGQISKTNENSIILSGTYTIDKNKVTITDLPVGYTSKSYEEVLRKLLDTDKIQNYENNSCKDQFNFVVVFKRGSILNPEKIEKLLKLNMSMTQNLTTLSIHGKVKEWENVSQLMDDFYDFRINIIKQRIARMLKSLQSKRDFLIDLIKFTKDVVNGKFSFKDKREDDLRQELLTKYPALQMNIDYVLNRPIRYFTKDLIEKSEQELQETEDKIQYYKNTNKEKEYCKDLTELKNAILKDKKYEKSN